jgi:hypothetical protein
VLHDGGPSKTRAVSKRGLATVSERSSKPCFDHSAQGLMLRKRMPMAVSTSFS